MEWRRFFVCIGLTFLFTLSCGEKKQPPTLPAAVMSKALADAHMAEGALLNVPYAKKDSMRVVYYAQIYEIHKISEEVFKEDMEYYQQNPDRMEDLYDQVIQYLEEKDKQLKKGEK